MAIDATQEGDPVGFADRDLHRTAADVTDGDRGGQFARARERTAECELGLFGRREYPGCCPGRPFEALR